MKGSMWKAGTPGSHYHYCQGRATHYSHWSLERHSADHPLEKYLVFRVQLSSVI